jgi:hypothetical protein
MRANDEAWQQTTLRLNVSVFNVSIEGVGKLDVHVSSAMDGSVVRLAARSSTRGATSRTAEMRVSLSRIPFLIRPLGPHSGPNPANQDPAVWLDFVPQEELQCTYSATHDVYRSSSILHTLAGRRSSHSPLSVSASSRSGPIAKIPQIRPDAQNAAALPPRRLGRSATESRQNVRAGTPSQVLSALDLNCSKGYDVFITLDA